MLPLLPEPPARFVAPIPGGGLIELFHKETLGWVTLIYGGFETVELGSVLAFAQPGTAVIDVGSNVGLYAVVMSRAVGREGLVLAVEPHPENVGRLRSNLRLNGAENVRIVEAAAAQRGGEWVDLHLSKDPAYHSLGDLKDGSGSSGKLSVPTVCLDELWHEERSPVVSLIKIDVEGQESAVLAGSREILATHHPALILEAGGSAELAVLNDLLSPIGYRRQDLRGYEPWNHLFVWTTPP